MGSSREELSNERLLAAISVDRAQIMRTDLPRTERPRFEIEKFVFICFLDYKYTSSGDG